jgi:hypothetical protein
MTHYACTERLLKIAKKNTIVNSCKYLYILQQALVYTAASTLMNTDASTDLDCC